MSQPKIELKRSERLAWLRLIRSDNVGPVTFRALLARFRSAEAALMALPALAKKGGRRDFKVYPQGEAERELDALEAFGARLLCSCEADYPPLLAELEDAPPVLALKGHAHLAAKRTLGIVGARNASANGAAFARRIAAELGRHGLVVVSGLARGIDGAAHQGALSSGTIAVVAGGIDVIYPPENRELHQRIAAEGAVVAEAPFGAEPMARSFVIRNRIISGLSLGVLVIEAGAKSGSLHTARFAAEQGRDVMAVPGSPMDPRAKGSNGLLREGAALIETAEDVLEALGRRRPLGEPAGRDLSTQAIEQPSESDVDAARLRVLGKLSPEPVEVDELLRQCQIGAPVVQTVLLELELAGRVRRHTGARVSLIVP
jgi:DNA processing protein